MFLKACSAISLSEVPVLVQPQESTEESHIRTQFCVVYTLHC
jgi:hypothetical protein